MDEHTATAIAELRAAAGAYCRVIETAFGMPRLDFVRDVAVTLSTVVAAAHRLPVISFEVDDTDDESISDERWRAVLPAIQGVVGDWDNYWTTYEAYATDRRGIPDLDLPVDPVNLSLADALADTWRDLRDGLEQLDRGASPDVVAFDWQLTFRGHWGAHATEALRAVQQQLR